ncbi:MAG: hypothetical protein HYV77_00780 [Candidatus Wildermuthbacteria bacterium]|nr:hypothetical protein [Candidatus Wildermuthbacteria bacterium]
MKFTIPLTTQHIVNVMRECGYTPDGQDDKTGELRFFRKMSYGLFPKFHAYCWVPERYGTATINLHLDQKAPSYRGSHAHSGEYDGDLIKTEAQRIENTAKNIQK